GWRLRRGRRRRGRRARRPGLRLRLRLGLRRLLRILLREHLDRGERPDAEQDGRDDEPTEPSLARELGPPPRDDEGRDQRKDDECRGDEPESDRMFGRERERHAGNLPGAKSALRATN